MELYLSAAEVRLQKMLLSHLHPWLYLLMIFFEYERMLERSTPVTLEADVKTQFFDEDLKGYNVVAEIPGSDPLLKDELVMLGGHMDYWHGATGATDNAAGCSVMMEVVRLLQSTGLKPRRTIRIALWGGEEQGLIGSRNYVTNHFTDSVAGQGIGLL